VGRLRLTVDGVAGAEIVLVVATAYFAHSAELVAKAAARWATAAPMPRLAPVTRTRLPSKRPLPMGTPRRAVGGVGAGGPGHQFLRRSATKSTSWNGADSIESSTTSLLRIR